MSAMPVVGRNASAFFATYRGSREYGVRVIGSRTSQMMSIVLTSSTGSMKVDVASGMRSMSLSWMCWNPLIDDPSKPMPPSKRPSESSSTGIEKCCHVPGRSTKRRSTIWTPSFFAIASTSLGEVLGAGGAAVAGRSRSMVSVIGSTPHRCCRPKHPAVATFG